MIQFDEYVSDGLVGSTTSEQQVLRKKVFFSTLKWFGSENLRLAKKKKDWKKIAWQFFVTFLGWLSDLQLGDEKVTLNHLVPVCSI